MDTAPHGLLFPRCKVIVHHGHLADDGMLPQVGRGVSCCSCDPSWMSANVTPNLCEKFLGCMRRHQHFQQKFDTPPICRHLFACLSKPQFPIGFLFPGTRSENPRRCGYIECLCLERHSYCDWT